MVRAPDPPQKLIEVFRDGLPSAPPLVTPHDGDCVAKFTPEKVHAAAPPVTSLDKEEQAAKEVRAKATHQHTDTPGRTCTHFVCSCHWRR